MFLLISCFYTVQGFQIIPIVNLEDVYVTRLCASSCHLRCEHDKDPIGLALKPYHVQISSDRRMLTIQWCKHLSNELLEWSENNSMKRSNLYILNFLRLLRNKFRTTILVISSWTEKWKTFHSQYILTLKDKYVP